MPPLLEVKNLVTRFHTYEGVVHAVNGVSFEVNEGETLAIVGESGCGKSVTMMSLLGLIPSPPGRIEAGQAIFLERDLLHASPAELRQVRGAQIGFIFQDPMTSLNPVLTIGEQIAESMVEHLGVSPADAERRAVDILRRVGIPDPAARFHSYPHQFSGGMRQRVMIAIAIACTPQILIADEPTTALDVTVQAQIVDLVTKLRDELGVAVIWITHDLGVVASLADRVLVMYAGLVVEQAGVDDLYERPQHPYTIGLLGALPRLDAAGEQRLVNIPGSPPGLLAELRQCPFAPRCPFVFDRCREQAPPLLPVGVGHQVACFYDVEKDRPRDV